MIHLADILTTDERTTIVALLSQADWIDGRATAGSLSRQVKRNRQLAEDDPGGLQAAAIVLDALARNAAFAAAALPARIAPPLFNRYDPGDTYGDHIDSAIRPLMQGRMRLDLSATLFLSDPSDYDGGALTIHGQGGTQSFKLPAGDLLLYSAGSVHRVDPVTRGTRLACFFWVHSMVRDPQHRALLLTLDQTIQRLAADPQHDRTSALDLTGLYHNLIRMWADA